jgi:hypothetical protein
VRFRAAYRCWREAVPSPGGTTVVYLEHLDHQLAPLSGEHGPFSGCLGGTHRDIRRPGSARSRPGVSGPARYRWGKKSPPEEFLADFERVHWANNRPQEATQSN